MDKLDYNEAYEHSFSNRIELSNSKLCGCFYCLEIYSTTKIEEWIYFYVNKEGDTAVCPECSVDSVIGDASGLPITLEFLTEMRKEHFE